MIAEKPVEEFEVGFHYGNMISMVADTYPKLSLVALEVVQNAIDGEGKDIVVVVNLQRHFLTFTDDGTGISKRKARQAVGSIGESLKTKTRKKKNLTEEERTLLKYGRFGLGMVSPVKKCVKFITTTRDEDGSYYEMEFVTKELISKASGLRIVPIDRPDIQHGPTEKILKLPGRGKVQQVPWSTKVHVSGLTTDRTVIDIESAEQFANAVFKKYGDVMRDRDITLTIELTLPDGKVERLDKIRAPKYTGEPLQLHVERPGSLHTVSFRLFLVTQGSRPKRDQLGVRLGSVDNPARVTAGELAKSSAREYVPKEVFKLLQLGIFEGDILSSQAEVHRDRDAFVDNERLIELCEALTAWYEAVGAPFVEELQAARQDERHQRLTKEALESVSNLLRKESFRELRDKLPEVPRRKTDQDASTDQRELNADRRRDKSKPRSKPVEPEDDDNTSADDKDNKKKQQQKRERDHSQSTVEGPKGTHRTAVESEEFGLRVVVEPMLGEDRLWVFYQDEMLLKFNKRHPIWEQCDRTSDKKVVQLQMIVLVEVITWSMLSEEEQEYQRELLDQKISLLAEMLLSSSAFK